MTDAPRSSNSRHRREHGRHPTHAGHDGQSGRRTQAERSATTITKLLDATADCLATKGYARTSTTDICRQAGVSRGAMLHHFPSKAVLVAAACEHIFQHRVDEFRDAMAQVPETDNRLEAAIDVLWDLFRSDTFAAWYELIVAGRTDPDLHPHVALVAGRLAETVRDTWNELFVLPPDTSPAVVAQFATAPVLMFAVLDGLALARMTGAPTVANDAERVLALVKAAAEPLGPVLPPSTLAASSPSPSSHLPAESRSASGPPTEDPT
jgi:AcrR family transcriptional regulator